MLLRTERPHGLPAPVLVALVVPLHQRQGGTVGSRRGEQLWRESPGAMEGDRHPPPVFEVLTGTGACPSL